MLGASPHRARLYLQKTLWVALYVWCGGVGSFNGVTEAHNNEDALVQRVRR